MPTTLRLRDYLLRRLTNATPGTSNVTDSLGRAIQAGNIDTLGRGLGVTAWAASTAYTLGTQVQLGTGQVLQVTTAGTSAASTPTAPGFGLPRTDGTVVWTQIANA